MKCSVAIACLLSATAFALSARAADAPEAIIGRMTERVLTEASQAGGTVEVAKVRQLVETIILPHVDFTAMTSRAVGVKWRSATDAQKAELMAAFQALLVKTYAGAFSQAQGARIKVQRVVQLDAETSEVRTAVATSGGSEPIPIVYRMALEGDDWKVVDVSVSGVWLVPTYRSQFAQVLQNGDVDALINALHEKAGVR
jgi:phospholipid transport system substrate-binding protein